MVVVLSATSIASQNALQVHRHESRFMRASSAKEAMAAKSTSGVQAEIRMLHLAMRANRQNFLAAQEELKRRGIKFDFQDHEISHSIYFRDPDGHQLEITTYELK